ncbi:hypothetical protein ACFE04_018238 [Oxalis oulophora]
MESLVCVLIFVVSMYFFLKYYLKTSTKTLPPGPRGLPIIGSLLKLGSHPNQSLYELSKIHGPLMTLRLGSMTTVIVSSAEMARNILQVNDQSFSDRHIPESVAAQPDIEGTLAWVNGDKTWRLKRRICNTELFNAKRLNSLQHLRQRKIEEMMEYIKKKSILSCEVDLGQIAFATTLNLISNTIFSIDIVDSDEFNKAQEFKELVWRIMEDGGKANLSDYFPIIKRFDLQGIKGHVKFAYLRLHEIFEELIEQRLENRRRSSHVESSSEADFLDVLLDHCQVDGSYFNRHNIKPLILDLFIAGSDTSAITTEWAMAELLKNPGTLRKVREEIIRVIGNGRVIQETDFNLLPYFQAFIKETMRLHPAAPLLLPYKASNDVQINAYTIPSGSQVLVNAWAIGRDPNYWDEPLTFRPERFLGSDIDYKGQSFEYIPFGAGRRICPGWPLAIRMIHLLVASIIQSFDWKLPDGINPESLDMEEQFGVTLKKALPLRAIPIQTTND